MRISKLSTIFLAVALMLSNIACACAWSGVASDNSDSSQTSHHHLGMDMGMDMGLESDEPSARMPCAHQDCEGCDELQDSCATPDYRAVSTERDNRPGTAFEADTYSGDFDLIDTVVDPPWHSPILQRVPPVEISAVAVYRPDTPVKRKDQLTE
ncbi:hypothetical protein [Congregibacter litoralis]|uniref:Uncharacterized protein n=1 Tax=Congregibacter litoralis KT71 TaxID=314285 RepID=A4A7T4_9GAMM|nr:hypothetical protein [Congregibacter litoralis]EAQ97729.1 hypothetical protein KT71_14204 [Congregibacter litoralis KT71]